MRRVQVERVESPRSPPSLTPPRQPPLGTASAGSQAAANRRKHRSNTRSPPRPPPSSRLPPPAVASDRRFRCMHSHSVLAVLSRSAPPCAGHLHGSGLALEIYALQPRVLIMLELPASWTARCLTCSPLLPRCGWLCSALSLKLGTDDQCIRSIQVSGTKITASEEYPSNCTTSTPLPVPVPPWTNSQLTTTPKTDAAATLASSEAAAVCHCAPTGPSILAATSRQAEEGVRFRAGGSQQQQQQWPSAGATAADAGEDDRHCRGTWAGRPAAEAAWYSEEGHGEEGRPAASSPLDLQPAAQKSGQSGEQSRAHGHGRGRPRAGKQPAGGRR